MGHIQGRVVDTDQVDLDNFAGAAGDNIRLALEDLVRRQWHQSF